jgi:hypothetical protein
MDLPALYSLAHPDVQHYDVILEDESNSSKAGYASSAQARLVLSFKTKVTGIFGADNSAKNGILLPPFWITVSGNLMESRRAFEIKLKTE